LVVVLSTVAAGGTIGGSALLAILLFNKSVVAFNHSSTFLFAEALSIECRNSKAASSATNKDG
jgi:hypothetical protein